MRARIQLSSTMRYIATIVNVSKPGPTDLPRWLHLTAVEVSYLYGSRNNTYWSDPTKINDRWVPTHEIVEVVPLDESEAA
jgi:hypothetical protein